MTDVIFFWILFAVLNTMYFLPRYLMDLGRSQFIPVRSFARGSVWRRLRHIVKRRNADMCRVSLEFFVLTVGYAFWLKDYASVPVYSMILFAWFALSLAYQLYHTVFEKLYHLEPTLFNDAFMLKTAARIFFAEFDLKNFFITLITVVGALISYVLIVMLLSLAAIAEFGQVSPVFAAVVIILGLYSLYDFRYTLYTQYTVQSQLQAIVHNLLRTWRARRDLAGLTLKKMKAFNMDPGARLKRKPNIYLIVIESYGRVLLDSPAFRDSYRKYVAEFNDRLRSHGWQMASSFTLSPVTGGASWLSYTSLMYGLNVHSQGIFLTLLNNPYVSEYDSLFHWLKRQDYTTFRLSSLGGYEKMEIPYDKYSVLYGIDHWIRYKDLNFRGREYGFGPSPPDQYALHFAHHRIKEMNDGPFALFYITQNSHSPYETPSEVAEDWRALSDRGDVTPTRSRFWSRPKFESYNRAIRYQLDFLTDFIARKGTPDDIFILVGDHQPPSLSIDIETFQTPMHIIAKDEAFLEQFRAFGFTPGLLLEPSNDMIRQDAFLSGFLRSFINCYGEAGATLPEYLPKGIPF
jgi:hypothetical protein